MGDRTTSSASTRRRIPQQQKQKQQHTRRRQQPAVIQKVHQQRQHQQSVVEDEEVQPEFILGTTNNAESHEETAATTTTLSLSDGVLRSADGQTVQLIAINANGEQEIISHETLLNGQLAHGMLVNYTTTQAPQSSSESASIQQQHTEQPVFVSTTEETDTELLPSAEEHEQQPNDEVRPAGFVQYVLSNNATAALRPRHNAAQPPPLAPLQSGKKSTKTRVVSSPNNPPLLPHKKRIITPSDSNSVSSPLTQSGSGGAGDMETITVFQCQLCSEPCSTQLEFFRHLQSHYESAAAGGAPQPSIEPNADDECAEQQAHFVYEVKDEETLEQRNNGGDSNMLVMHVHRTEGTAEVVDGLYVMNEMKTEAQHIDGVENTVVLEQPEEEEEGEPCDGEWFDEEELDEDATFNDEIAPTNDDGMEVDGEPHASQSIPTRSSTSQKPADNNSGRRVSKRMSTGKKHTLASQMDCFEEILTAAEPPLNSAPVGVTVPSASEPPKSAGRSAATRHVIDKNGLLLATKTYKCRLCDKVCNTKNSLQYHFLMHTGERPHECDVCGKGFFAKSALNVHQRLHTGDKPYTCEECGRAFRQWGDLRYHMTSLHSDEKNHQCEFCGKDFARRYSLVIHRRIHTGERNYVCEFCNKAFRASTYLQDHRRIHTGEKPHECEFCHKKFRVRGDLKRHWNIHTRTTTGTTAVRPVVVVRHGNAIADDAAGGGSSANADDDAVGHEQQQQHAYATATDDDEAVAGMLLELAPSDDGGSDEEDINDDGMVLVKVRRLKEATDGRVVV